MKGEITLNILETIEDMAMTVVDLVVVISTSGYGASYSKLQYNLDKIRSGRISKEIKKDLAKQDRQKYYNLLYKLKKDGLMLENKNNKILTLTKKGKNKIFSIRENLKKRLPDIHYEKESGGKNIIITFDVPENKRGKREWLREVLRNLDLQMIQKSVWVGKIKIPKKFIEDLRKLDLIDCVEIFEISKTGSLKQIT
ncbi:CRISPR-associated endonuclease Cas2 [Candidatus Wolfebacteria bacterium]|nr:CRISPR-associated endonuclease Cas2 [Candidatus Wolfebacteria bacterium]